MTQFRLIVFVGMVLGAGVAVWSSTGLGTGVRPDGAEAAGVRVPASADDLSSAATQIVVDERVPLTIGASTSTAALAGYVRHEPDKSDLDRYRKLRLRAKNVGVELPRSIFGTAQMWSEIKDVEESYWRDIADARSERSRAMHKVAFRMRKENAGERVGNLGEFQRGNRSSGSSDREVMVSTGEGTYSIIVAPGMDAEVDRLDTDFRVLSAMCAEALAHVLRTHGAM
jgi:hypothetical protein